MKNKRVIRRFLHYYKDYTGTLIFDMFCALLSVVCSMVFPVIVQYLTDTALNDISALTLPLIFTVGGIYLILRLIDSAAYYYMQSYGHIMGSKMERDMRRDLFNHLQKLDFTYYANTKIGQIMSRITSDLFDVTEFAHHCPEQLLIAGAKIIVTFAILATYNIWLTLVLFIMLPLMILLSRHFNKKMRLTFKDKRRQLGEINASVEDSLLGIRVVKSFANEEIEEEKFKKQNTKFLDINRKAYHAMAGFHGVNRAFEGVMYIVVVVVGAIFLIKDMLSVGEFMAFLLYISTMLSAITTLVDFSEQFQRGITGIERFYEIMDVEVNIKDSENAVELINPEGNISFEHVTFTYNNEQDVLKDINLHIKKGENIAIVGPSGSGKTTLCNLIPRFYELSDGRITIDGKDIRDFTLHSLRTNIGIVQQDVYLFSGTVKENIAYGRQDATDEEIIAAAKAAGADEFISQLTSGYDSYIGERGIKLSGGQKQRISIARVFLKNPPILILDEATSSLDNESERVIQESLESLSKGRTTITIAHRLTTIENADRILVLTSNGIEESGTHEELLEMRGLYYKMNR